MVRQIDVSTLWVSLKEAEFSSRSRFCERRRLPIECRGVPSISTQNIDQNNCQQKLFSKIFMFFIETQKRQKKCILLDSFQFCPEIIIFIAFGPRNYFHVQLACYSTMMMCSSTSGVWTEESTGRAWSVFWKGFPTQVQQVWLTRIRNNLHN